MTRPARNWIALAVGTVLALGASYAAYQLADYSWNQVVDYRGPYAKVALPETLDPRAPAGGLPEAKRAQPSRRIVFVIVDGLREDVSRKLPALNALRERGYDAVVRTSQPSLSFPNWTTLLSGAPQRISGVTTNWFEERIPVETLVDVALRDGLTVAVSAPTDFEMLYGVKRTGHVFLQDWVEGTYMTGPIFDNAIRLAEESSATLVVVHSPDIDEAGHAAGGASKEYLDTALKVDKDLARLVQAMQDDRTTFVIASDHGHIDTGGHGGWEDVATNVPAVFAGAGVSLGKGEGEQDQVAPSVAMLAELPAPRHATGAPLEGLRSGPVWSSATASRFDAQQTAAFDAYAAAVTGQRTAASASASQAKATFERTTDERLAAEQRGRLPLALAIAGMALAVLVAIGLMSWRALVSAACGAVGYYIVYEGLYFGLHRYGLWSLSSFNSESMLKGFMNARMIEAAIAGVVAVFVAADIYLVTRAVPRRPKGEYLPGWLALGTSTVLVVQATLALQVAWFLWWSGAQVSWRLPDFMWAFKYDLDLIQGTALAGAALLAPLVAWLVGRYHPIRSKAAGAARVTEAPEPSADGASN
ncbi:MAG TPA: alkaline phosphatase family protein [Coriobacteriia bacterium]